MLIVQNSLYISTRDFPLLNDVSEVLLWLLTMTISCENHPIRMMHHVPTFADDSSGWCICGWCPWHYMLWATMHRKYLLLIAKLLLVFSCKGSGCVCRFGLSNICSSIADIGRVIIGSTIVIVFVLSSLSSRVIWPTKSSINVRKYA